MTFKNQQLLMAAFTDFNYFGSGGTTSPLGQGFQMKHSEAPQSVGWAMHEAHKEETRDIGKCFFGKPEGKGYWADQVIDRYYIPINLQKWDVSMWAGLH